MKKLLFFAACLAIWGAAHIVSAQTPTMISVTGTIGGTNNLTVGLPGTHDVSKEGPVGLIGNLYDFALMAGGILAFGSILYGAVVYLAQPGNHEAQSGAKARIRDAFLGLLLLAGIYMILHIVNPGLTKLQFPTLTRLEPPVPATSSTLPSDNTTMASQGSCGILTGDKTGWKDAVIPAGTLRDGAARTLLQSAGITVNKADCTAKGQTACTSLDGIPLSAIDGIKRVAAACKAFDSSCSIIITGGTEAGHAEHGVCKNRLDIVGRPTDVLDEFILEITNESDKEGELSQAGNQICDLNGVNYYWETPGTAGGNGTVSTGAHYHVRLGQWACE
jgi:hypothetical protein